MRILTAIVLYKPCIQNVLDMIDVMQPYVSYFYLWDNTPGGCGCSEIRGYEVHRLNTSQSNIGLSGAYNKALDFARLNNCDYLQTMDQDSQWHKFDNYIELVKKRECTEKGKTVYFVNMQESNLSDYTEMNQAGVNSGAIIPVNFLDQIGGYTSEFFIDAIDDWLAIQALRNDMKCILVGNCRIIQSIGNTYIGRFLWKKQIVHDYPPHRLYGIFRNYMILWHYYPMSDECKEKVINLFFKNWIKSIIFYQNNKILKIRAIICGINDGLKRLPSRRLNFIK